MLARILPAPARSFCGFIVACALGTPAYAQTQRPAPKPAVQKPAPAKATTAKPAAAKPTAVPAAPQRTGVQAAPPPPKANAAAKPATNVAPAKPGAKPDPNLKAAPSDAGVREQFGAALRLSQAGKVDDAMMAFEQLIRRYPGHQPSLIQYGKLLYSRDRIPEAYQAFSRINPVGLDPETTYEYALSHFWMRQYEQALYGFRRIPEGHALYDLANYYGAIAALKLRRLVEAEAMMDKAVVLPDQLAASRKNYIKHIQDMKSLQERQGLSEERDRERKRIEDALKKEEPVRLTASQQMAQAMRYTHRGFEEVEVAPLVGASYKYQVNDKHGFAEEIASLRTTYFEFKGGLLFPLPVKYHRNQAAFGLQLSGRAEEQVREGKEQRNVQTDDLEDIQRISNADPTHTLTKFGAYSVGAWLEVPTPMRVWLGLGLRFSQKFIDFEANQRSGISEAWVQLGSKERGREYRARYQYGEITNTKNERMQIVHQMEFEWHLPFTRALALDALLTHKIFQYDDEAMDGPSSTSSLVPDLFYTLPYGFTLGLKAAGIYQSDFVYHDLPTVGTVSANGTTTMGQAYVKVEPVKWFSLTISQLVQKTTWDVQPKEGQEIFEQNHVDYQEEFEAKAELNLFF